MRFRHSSTTINSALLRCACRIACTRYQVCPIPSQRETDAVIAAFSFRHVFSPLKPPRGKKNNFGGYAGDLDRHTQTTASKLQRPWVRPATTLRFPETNRKGIFYIYSITTASKLQLSLGSPRVVAGPPPRATP